jgi:hypothetical protein
MKCSENRTSGKLAVLGWISVHLDLAGLSSYVSDVTSEHLSMAQREFQLVGPSPIKRHIANPLRFLVGFGLVWLMVSLAATIPVVCIKFGNEYSIRTLLLVLGAMSFMMGYLSFLIALLAKVVTRTYSDASLRPIYRTRQEINFAARQLSSCRDGDVR